jgi:hypothetical protein
MRAVLGIWPPNFMAELFVILILGRPGTGSLIQVFI